MGSDRKSETVDASSRNEFPAGCLHFPLEMGWARSPRRGTEQSLDGFPGMGEDLEQYVPGHAGRTLSPSGPGRPQHPPLGSADRAGWE